MGGGGWGMSLDVDSPMEGTICLDHHWSRLLQELRESTVGPFCRRRGYYCYMHACEDGWMDWIRHTNGLDQTYGSWIQHVLAS
jgi:hypothetical protein